MGKVIWKAASDAILAAVIITALSLLVSGRCNANHPAYCLVHMGTARGCGALISPNLVVTAAHVIRGERGQVVCQFPFSGGVQLRGRVLKADHVNDIAVLHVQKTDKIAPMKLAEAQPPVGSQIWFAGRPGGWSRDRTRPAKVVSYRWAPSAQAPPCIEFGLSTISGESGGPAWNASGLVGLLTGGDHVTAMGPHIGTIRVRLQQWGVCGPGTICQPPMPSSRGRMMVPAAPRTTSPATQYAGPRVPIPVVKPQPTPKPTPKPPTVTLAQILDAMAKDDRFKPIPGPEGPKGDKGDPGEKGDKGDEGEPGSTGVTSVDSSIADRLDALEAEIERLKGMGIEVVFEGGDDPGEDERIETVKLGGRLVIPATGLRVNNVDMAGAQMYHDNGEPQTYTDLAPAGGLLRFQFRQPLSVVE